MKCPMCHSYMPKLSGQERVYEPDMLGNYPSQANKFMYHRTVSPLWACTNCHTVIWDDLEKEEIARIKALNKKRERASKGTDIAPAGEPKMEGQKLIEELEEE